MQLVLARGHGPKWNIVSSVSRCIVTANLQVKNIVNYLLIFLIRLDSICLKRLSQVAYFDVCAGITQECVHFAV